MASQTAPRILGVTGPIACGKTTVGDILLHLGALERIDADRVVHELEGPGTETTRQIARAFGSEILAPDGSVDRRTLAALVFGRPDRLRLLEGIVHPAVRATIRERLSLLAGQRGVVVIDAVKLLQSDLLPLCDAVWVVLCSPDEQRRRLIEKRGMTPKEVGGRLVAQPAFHHPRVTAVIRNSGSLDDLEREVRRLWDERAREWDLKEARPS